jgi:hypothetical protein
MSTTSLRNEPPELIAMRMRAMRAAKAARKTGDQEPVILAQREYAEAKIKNRVRRILEESPPLTEDQRLRLRSLFDRDAA